LSTTEKHPFERLRSKRTIVGQVPTKPVTLTVFVGTYNAGHHLAGLLSSLNSQAWTPEIQLIIADNSSDDETLDALREWRPSNSLGSYSLIENFSNVGACGSLYLNLDMAKGQWITFIHQDDLYESNYLELCLQAICEARSTDTATISFDYLTKEDQQRPRYQANPTWFADGQVESKKFLQNLANHAIPWPCTVFRASYFQRQMVPFHSSAFLDTELALINVQHGSNIYRAERPLSYRVHAASASHSILSEESEFARFASMIRVFGSRAFAEVLDTIPDEMATSWITSVIYSAQSYFEKVDFREVLELIVLETSILHTEYRISELNELLARVYLDLGGTQAAQILYNMSSRPIELPVRERLDFASAKTLGLWSLPKKLRYLLSGPVFKLFMRFFPKWLLPHPWRQFK